MTPTQTLEDSLRKLSIYWTFVGKCTEDDGHPLIHAHISCMSAKENLLFLEVSGMQTAGLVSNSLLSQNLLETVNLKTRFPVAEYKSRER